MPLGHGRAKDGLLARLARHHPALAFAAITIAVPIAEEIVWRHLPLRSLRWRHKPFAVSLAFAATHAGKEALPVPQFMSGLNYWELHQVDGFWAAVVAHSTRNALGAAKYVCEKR
ncbi:MAG TPA: CPBP family intramembrane glutamic endopeptidase [Candidatus Saccharimonadales bacterium]|nr:CPBP family intramembrane glutamic endopeptidase [Candidatus Saccharimonadales bacterium]